MPEWYPGALLQHRGDHGDAGLVHTAYDDAARRFVIRRWGQQGLNLAEQGTLAIEGYRDGCPERDSPAGRGTDRMDRLRPRCRSRAAESSRPHRLGEAILDSADHSDRGVPVPSNCRTTSTRCSKVLGPAMDPSLVTCPTITIATPVDFAAAVSAAVTAHLGDTARNSVSIGCGHGLDRVDDHQSGLDGVDVPQHGLRVRLCSQEHFVVPASCAFGTHADLTGRFLTRDVQRPPARFGPMLSHLEQEGGFADAGIPGQQSHGPRNDPPPSTRSSSPTPVGEVAGMFRIDRADSHGGRQWCRSPLCVRPEAAAAKMFSSMVPQVPQSGQRRPTSSSHDGIPSTETGSEPWPPG